MKIHDPAETDWEQASEHRTPDIRIKKLLQDASDREFEFNLVEFTNDDFFSPRHRHNFDQFRIGLSGVTKYGKTDVLTEGLVAYYPEGTSYGPQTVEKAPTLQAIIQFGGASGAEYVNYQRLDAATAELAERGTFQDGYYRFEGEDGAMHNIDAYQASWERATGDQMVYPEPRLLRPLYLDHRNFPWLEGSDGVATKQLFTASETETGLSMLRVAAGCEETLSGDGRPTVGLLLGGRLEVEGGEYGKYSAVLVEGDEKVTVTATETAELVLVHLPRFQP